MRAQTLLTDRGVQLDVQVPKTRRERMRGLRGRRWLAPGEALLLERTRSVHTVGMRFDLAIAFLSDGYHVIDVIRVCPGRLLLPRRRARHVLELRTDADLRRGDRLERVARSP